jgi:hypothetical protein
MIFLISRSRFIIYGYNEEKKEPVAHYTLRHIYTVMCNIIISLVSCMGRSYMENRILGAVTEHIRA